MKVLYEGLICTVLEKDDSSYVIQDKNGNIIHVDESEVIVIYNLNEDI